MMPPVTRTRELMAFGAPATTAQLVAEARRLCGEARALRRESTDCRTSMRLAREGWRFGLRQGQDLDEVRRRMAGWEDHPILVSDSRDGCCCSVWDFIDPGGNRRLRMTFLDERLVVWGVPAAAR